MTDANKLTRWRIESETGHVVFLYAADMHHARQRWEEFYPGIPVNVLAAY